VDGVALRHEATLQEYRKQGINWSSVTPAQVEFEKRLTSALMLQQNLVALDRRDACFTDRDRSLIAAARTHEQADYSRVRFHCTRRKCRET